MSLWTVQLTMFNIEADDGDTAFTIAYDSLADREPDLVLIDMQGWKYNADFLEHDSP